MIDISELADEDLGEDDVFVLESIAEAKKNDEDKLRVSLILTMKESMAALGKVVKIIEVRLSNLIRRISQYLPKVYINVWFMSFEQSVE